MHTLRAIPHKCFLSSVPLRILYGRFLTGVSFRPYPCACFTGEIPKKFSFVRMKTLTIRTKHKELIIQSVFICKQYEQLPKQPGPAIYTTRFLQTCYQKQENKPQRTISSAPHDFFFNIVIEKPRCTDPNSHRLPPNNTPKKEENPRWITKKIPPIVKESPSKMP